MRCFVPSWSRIGLTHAGLRGAACIMHYSASQAYLDYHDVFRPTFSPSSTFIHTKMGDREITIPGDYPSSHPVELFSGQTAGGSARQHNGNLYNSKRYSPPRLSDQLQFTDPTQTILTTILLRKGDQMNICVKTGVTRSYYVQQPRVSTHASNIFCTCQQT